MFILWLTCVCGLRTGLYHMKWFKKSGLKLTAQGHVMLGGDSDVVMVRKQMKGSQSKDDDEENKNKKFTFALNGKAICVDELETLVTCATPTTFTIRPRKKKYWIKVGEQCVVVRKKFLRMGKCRDKRRWAFKKLSVLEESEYSQQRKESNPFLDLESKNNLEIKTANSQNNTSLNDNNTNIDNTPTNVNTSINDNNIDNNIDNNTNNTPNIDKNQVDEEKTAQNDLSGTTKDKKTRNIVKQEKRLNKQTIHPSGGDNSLKVEGTVHVSGKSQNDSPLNQKETDLLLSNVFTTLDMAVASPDLDVLSEKFMTDSRQFMTRMKNQFRENEEKTLKEVVDGGIGEIGQVEKIFGEIRGKVAGNGSIIGGAKEEIIQKEITGKTDENAALESSAQTDGGQTSGNQVGEGQNEEKPMADTITGLDEENNEEKNTVQDLRISNLLDVLSDKNKDEVACDEKK